MKVYLRKGLITAIGIISIVFMSVLAKAAVPLNLNFQGKLTDDAGQAKSGDFDFVFRIYDNKDGSGTALWTETHNNVSVTSGLYSVILGSTTALDISDFENALWLEVAVEGNKLSPLYKLTAAPYAISAVILDNSTTGYIILEQSTSPSDKTEGRIQWDTDNNQIVVGTGTGVAVISPGSDDDNVSGDVDGSEVEADTLGSYHIIASTITTTEILDGTIKDVDVDLSTAAISSGKWDSTMILADDDYDIAVSTALYVDMSSVIASSIAVSAIGPNQIVADKEYDIAVSTALYVDMSSVIASSVAVSAVGPNQIAADKEFDISVSTALYVDMSSVIASSVSVSAIGPNQIVADKEYDIAVSTALYIVADIEYDIAVSTALYIDMSNVIASSVSVSAIGPNQIAADKEYDIAVSTALYIDMSTVIASSIALSAVGPGQLKKGVYYEDVLVSTANSISGDLNLNDNEIVGVETLTFINSVSISTNNTGLAFSSTITVSGDVDASGYTVYASSFYVQSGADLAEVFPSKDKLEPGDVVCISKKYDEEIVRSGKKEDTAVAGVVSTSPGFVLNSGAKGYKIALTGRVPVKVCNENGPIKRGDPLTTSSSPGYAMKAAEYKAGTVLGKAMESFSDEEGKIIVLITLQ
ncbi:hypothetical protein ACFLUV_07110 [Elusimicrobiota bacterium]